MIKWRRSGYYTIIILVFLGNLKISWLRWGDLIIDTFRDQWVYLKLSQGAVLYKDIFYVYGPLPPYLGSALFRIFGVNLNCSIFLGILILSLTTFILYRLCRLFLGHPWAVLLIAHFLTIFAFSAYSYLGIFNFILPYASASTLWVMFAVTALYLLLKYFRTGRSYYLIGWSGMLCLCFFCRIELTGLLWLWFFFFGLFLKPRAIRTIFIFYHSSALLVAIVSYFIFFSATDSFQAFQEIVLKHMILTIAQHSSYSSFTAGFNDVPESLRLILIVFLLHIIVLYLLYRMSIWIACIRATSGNWSLNALIVLAILILGGFSGYFLREYVDYQFRMTPFMLLIVLFAFLRPFLAHIRTISNKVVILFTLFSFALLLVLRIFLKAGPQYYGFCFLIPTLVCYYVFCFQLIPSFLANWFPQTSISRFHYQLFLSYLIIVFAIPGVSRNYSIYNSRVAEHNFVGIGRLYTFSDLRTQRIVETFNYLYEHIPPQHTLVVFPEGIVFNFILRRDNPLHYHTFIPDYISVIDEQVIITSLQESRVDYIVLVQRDTLEYGASSFGVDYAQALMSWIMQNYQLEKIIGSFPYRSQEFGTALFKRNQEAKNSESGI
ncbi:hypothetical protein JXQ70_05745 [bacterium]|nr:hypothetical protein [bacterium]